MRSPLLGIVKANFVLFVVKCQLIDLGEWASEEHKIAAKPSEQPSAKEVDIEEIEAMLAKQSDDFFKH